jgi:hypothetical protein
MGRRRVHRREIEQPAGPHLGRGRAGARRSEPVAAVAGEVLRLQRSGGNEAVGSLLAQRQPVPADSGSGKDEAVRSTLIADDPIGVMPLLSFSRSSETDFRVILPSTAKDTILMRYCAHGQTLGTVKISTTGFSVTLEDVVISSCEPGGSGETIALTLNTPPVEKRRR